MSDDETRRFAAGGPSALVVRTAEEADRLARTMAGEEHPNRVLFFCMQCGWKSTLELDDDEIEAIPTGSPRDYAGPCPGCGSMVLRPFDLMFGGTETIDGMAKRNRRSEYEEAADVFLDRAMSKATQTFIGMPMPQAAPAAADANVPAWAQNLDDSPVDPNTVKPRGGR